MAHGSQDLLGPGQVGLGRPSSPADRAEIPAPTVAGVLGMARTTAVEGASHDSSRARGTPAMIDRTRATAVAARARQASSPDGGLHRDDRRRRRR